MSDAPDPGLPSVAPASWLIRKLKSTAQISARDRADIENLSFTVRTFGGRTSIVHEGDVPKQCCLVMDGWAYRCRSLANGQRQIFAFYVPGDIPDIESLHLHVMDQGLVAIAQTTVAFVAHSDMRALIERNTSLAMALWRDTLIDATRCRERVISLGRRQAVGRMAHLFCEMYIRLRTVGVADDFRYVLPLTQAELADALGLSSVHANRSLQELRKLGFVTLHRRELIIQDWDGLETVAEFDPAYLHIV
ncbi:Crp/Fnr family transcriptional regulator [Methylobacterium sp. WL116]|uniref:Crp/Fnr family transcriptional regulator n=1 Tax=Methylobacterium sp. WL116 TaxID=2603889 RepID=UPI0011CB1FF1|nr:Crp/Fnr family transcriptional regulator [Methylobacterium sp. WL116]TXM93505.1 Crp/Fnr family transcriptional regulator [Methylobacterium sp. WL116]